MESLFKQSDSAKLMIMITWCDYMMMRMITDDDKNAIKTKLKTTQQSLTFHEFSQNSYITMIISLFNGSFILLNFETKCTIVLFIYKKTL